MTFVRTLALAVCAALVALVPAPLAGASPAADHPVAAPRVQPLPADAPADYQLGGAYRPAPGVRVVVRDRTDAPAGRYDVCYVNGFQTQPGTLRWWKRHHPALLLRDGAGDLVTDPGWPGEYLLDTSRPALRQGVARVVGRWIAGCARDGFDAVEPDNLDSFLRSRHHLTRSDNLATARLLATRAHREGLAIAQKNMAGVTPAERRRVGFDFAVVEECAVYTECGRYARTYGNRIIQVEYTDNGRAAYRRACRGHGERWSIQLRDRMLRTPAHPAYLRRQC